MNDIIESTGESRGTVAAIVTAGGSGTRFGQTLPKQFVNLAGWPVLAHTLSKFDQTTEVDRVIVVVPEEHLKLTRQKIVDAFGFSKVAGVVPGGETRQESVYNGFLSIGEDVDLVVIHDGVRPLVSISTIEAVIDAAFEHGAAMAAVPVRDTLKLVQDDVIQSTLDRSHVWQAQTPQAFNRLWLAEALAAARRDGFTGTDESALLERLGRPVMVVPGAADNLKITMPEDIVLAETLLKYDGKERSMRVGNGFDVHKFVPNRKLMLGCVKIPFDRGLEGHSDADVIVHALCDAILGALGRRDIGVHFPDDDPKWAGVAGKTLLKVMADMLTEEGFEIVNADLTLVAERPKIRDYVPDMIKAMADALGVETSRLNLKGTTMEGLGAFGRQEGMAAMAVVLLRRRGL